MNIKEAAARVSLPIKTIRYYDAINLINPIRDNNGYRDFQSRDLHKLAFVSQARSLGLTIDDCRALLAMYEDESRESADVKKLARQHLVEIEAKIEQLNSMRDTLSHLIDKCAGDDRPECPILENFGGSLQFDSDR